MRVCKEQGKVHAKYFYIVEWDLNFNTIAHTYLVAAQYSNCLLQLLQSLARLRLCQSIQRSFTKQRVGIDQALWWVTENEKLMHITLTLNDSCLNEYSPEKKIFNAQTDYLYSIILYTQSVFYLHFTQCPNFLGITVVPDKKKTTTWGKCNWK